MNYQEQYYKKFTFNDYYYYKPQNYPLNFDKNALLKNLENYSSKYNIDIYNLKTYLVHYYKKYFNSLIENNKTGFIDYKKYGKIIDIYSPFFDILSKNDFFEKIFSIPIIIKTIEKYQLKNDYCKVFENLNKLNINYSSLKIYIKDYNGDFLKTLNINLNQIRRLTIYQLSDNYENKINYLYCNLEYIFSYKDLVNNLVYLEINLSIKKGYYFDYRYKLDINDMKIINNLKSLEQLILDNFNFIEILNLKLYNLKKLALFNSSNITFAKNSGLSIKELIIHNTVIIQPSTLFNLPKLEICDLDKCRYIKNYYYFSSKKFNGIIDFNSLKNLKILKGNLNDFHIFENSLSESLDKKKIFEKLIKINTLKNIEIIFSELKDRKIIEIEEGSDSVISLYINWNIDYDYDLKIYNFQEKFPNLNELKIHLISYIYDCKTELKINENAKCKINKFSIKTINTKKIEFYCGPYTNLVDISFKLDNEILNLKECFPIFSDKCEIIFKSLTNFKFIFGKKFKKVKNYYLNRSALNYNILNNIYNNIDSMPNLKSFILICVVKEIDLELYEKIIKKLLLLEIINIKLEIQKEWSDTLGEMNNEDELYTIKELKEKFPDLNKYYELNNIYIKKLK